MKLTEEERSLIYGIADIVRISVEAGKEAQAEEIERLRNALNWIIRISDANYEQDEKLRWKGARTLKRISDRANAALAPSPTGREGT